MIDDVDISSSVLRLLASQALKGWNDDAVFKLLSDDDYILRTLVARELHVRGNKEIYDKVTNFEKSPREDMREICAFTLGQLGTPKMPYKNETIPILLNLIRDSSADVRAASAAACGHSCFENMPSEVEDALLRAVADEDKGVRCCVAYALGNASSKIGVIEAFNKLLQDSDSQVREYAELGKDIFEDNKNRGQR